MKPFQNIKKENVDTEKQVNKLSKMSSFKQIIALLTVILLTQVANAQELNFTVKDSTEFVSGNDYILGDFTIGIGAF